MIPRVKREPLNKMGWEPLISISRYKHLPPPLYQSLNARPLTPNLPLTKDNTGILSLSLCFFYFILLSLSFTLSHTYTFFFFSLFLFYSFTHNPYLSLIIYVVITLYTHDEHFQTSNNSILFLQNERDIRHTDQIGSIQFVSLSLFFFFLIKSLQLNSLKFWILVECTAQNRVYSFRFWQKRVF